MVQEVKVRSYSQEDVCHSVLAQCGPAWGCTLQTYGRGKGHPETAQSPQFLPLMVPWTGGTFVGSECCSRGIRAHLAPLASGGAWGHSRWHWGWSGGLLWGWPPQNQTQYGRSGHPEPGSGAPPGERGRRMREWQSPRLHPFPPAPGAPYIAHAEVSPEVTVQPVNQHNSVFLHAEQLLLSWPAQGHHGPTLPLQMKEAPEAVLRMQNPTKPPATGKAGCSPRDWPEAPRKLSRSRELAGH